MCLGHGVNKRIELVDGVAYICRNEGSLEVSGLDALRLSDGFGVVGSYTHSLGSSSQGVRGDRCIPTGFQCFVGCGALEHVHGFLMEKTETKPHWTLPTTLANQDLFP